MPADPTPPFDRNLALACHVRTVRQCWLELRCCDGTTLLPLRDMGADDRRTLADVLVRLRCRMCRGRPTEVTLLESPQQPPAAYGGRPPWRLMLIDAGE